MFGAGALMLLAACTERRTASDPVPDGDTIEVVIDRHEQPAHHPIEIESPAEPDTMKTTDNQTL